MEYVYDAADEWGAEPWNVTTKNCSEVYDVSARRRNTYIETYLFILNLIC